VNGNQVREFEKDSNYPLLLYGVVPGANEVEVRFANKYRKDGQGFHSFVDPVDSN